MVGHVFVILVTREVPMENVHLNLSTPVGQIKIMTISIKHVSVKTVTV
jgi:hypothetical protein